MEIHVGKMIGEQMAPLMTKAKLARLLGVTQPTAALMLQTKSMQTDKLILVSQKLDYNFFRVISKRIGVKNPGIVTEDVRDKQIVDLTAEVARLREENRYLKKAIDLLGGRG